MEGKDSERVRRDRRGTAGFDAAHGYPVEEAPAHRRSAQVVARAANAVHPSRDGYPQLADRLFAWLLHHA